MTGGADGRPSVLFHLPHMRPGGAERVTAILAGWLVERGWRAGLVLNRAEGALLDTLHPAVAVHDLGAARTAAAVTPLLRTLMAARTDIVVGMLPYCSVSLLLARLAGATAARTVVAEHGVLSAETAESRSPRLIRALIRTTYSRSDALVAVSRGAARDMAALAGVPPSRVAVIHNPVAGDADTAPPRPDDPWFAAGEPPVLVAAGRLVPLKGFDTLLQAVALLRGRLPVRLVILGEGPERNRLLALRDRLDLAAHVRLPGHVADPAGYMAAAAAVVVSSVREGFGNVLVEAMALGTPVVSTDCPHGPGELLEGGRLGPLVPVGDAAALAGAIAATLAAPPDPAPLRRRAADFTPARCCARWEDLLLSLLPGAAAVQSPASPRRVDRVGPDRASGNVADTSST